MLLGGEGLAIRPRLLTSGDKGKAALYTPEGTETMTDDILLFFSQRMEALPLYEKLEGMLLEAVPDARIKVAKTQIGFSNRRGFAFVSFNPCRRAKERPAVWITVSFGLGYRKDAERIDVATEPYPGRWTHHVMVGSAAEIDGELVGWLKEAADFSAGKR